MDQEVLSYLNQHIKLSHMSLKTPLFLRARFASKVRIFLLMRNFRLKMSYKYNFFH